MTRINLIDPRLLSDQHLFAEWREMPRIASSVSAMVAKGKTLVQPQPRYVMGKGHMTFFYDKLAFLSTRYRLICKELDRRQLNYQKYDGDPFLDLGLGPEFSRPYAPDARALALSWARIKLKLELRPDWYRYYKQTQGKEFFIVMYKAHSK